MLVAAVVPVEKEAVVLEVVVAPETVDSIKVLAHCPGTLQIIVVVVVVVEAVPVPAVMVVRVSLLFVILRQAHKQLVEL